MCGWSNMKGTCWYFSIDIATLRSMTLSLSVIIIYHSLECNNSSSQSNLFLFSEWCHTMSHLDDPNEYKRNPLYERHEPSNYVPFYVTLALCTVFAIFLCVLNIFFCCISKHKDYWKDTNTGLYTGTLLFQLKILHSTMEF